MPDSRHFVDQRRKNWCAVIILLAVCSLTMSLATRYGALWGDSSHAVRTVHTHGSLDAKRQRLTKNAATWLPPVFSFTVLEDPGFYPSISPAGPAAPTLLFEENLFNRPPPSA